MTSLFEPLTFAHGPAMPNRFMLAPLTNLQSHPDGVMSEDEFRWLTLRAKGGFGLTMTCAAHVQAVGQGFPGQMGVFGDQHLPGLTRMAAAIRAEGSVAVAQLHHAGMRSPSDLIGEAPHCPSANDEFKARALTGAEVEQLTEDFIAAAVRAERAGFDGVELHGAHGYVLCQFLSAEINQRTDRWGGSLENRSRIITDIIDGVRARCGPDFSLGVRLSPERFGMKLAEVRDFAAELMARGDVDYLDLSLWDAFKEPIEPEFHGRSLLSWFTDLPRNGCRIGPAGKITGAEDAQRILDEGCDFAVVGRSGILHHDFPKKVAADPHFRPIALPVTREHLRAEGLGPAFVEYMNGWKGFVVQEAVVPAE